MRKFGLLIVLLIAVLSAATPPVLAQQDIVGLTVNAGYDGRYRENTWVPLLINVTNNGDPIEGRLVARPERSSALTNTFSTPVSLPTNARQAVFMYVSIKGFGRTLLVELFDNQDTLVTEVEVPISSVFSSAQLYVVVTNGANSALNLNGIGPAGTESFQANWFPSNIPDFAPALDAVDVMVFSDVDSGTLTSAQRQAISDWVLKGGHLIVTGGANWQPTAAGLSDLLPLVPSSSGALDDLSALADFAGADSNRLRSQAIAATGDLTDDARVMVATEADNPLLVRRTLGNGTIDYLAVDPSLAPLRTWNRLPDMWLTMLTTVDARPGWTLGFVNAEPGNDAMEVLPGVNALPEVMAMVGFLAAYVLLVGPVNYFVLSRLNRRELAWLTIPLLIGLFSVLAWVTGFNLRGNEVILSRLSVVQSWPDAERAELSQFIGLLAPRRANYTLALPDNRALRPIVDTDTSTGSFFGAASAAFSNVSIQEAGQFSAVDFPVDASEVRGFNTSGFVEKPALSGQVNIAYSPDGDRQFLRGSVRNDTNMIIYDPVILYRGSSYRLEGPLEPGDLVVFGGESGLALGKGPLAIPTPLEFEVGVHNATLPRTAYWNRPQAVNLEQSAIDIIGQENYRPAFYAFTADTTTEEQELFRRQSFLNTFMLDQYFVPARGNRVFLAGWTNAAPVNEDLAGAAWRAVDTTLYLAELEVRFEQPITPVTISPDQFTWVAVQRDALGMVSPALLTISSDSEVAFRFTPLAEAVLSQVDELYLVVVGREGNASSRSYHLNLWNWDEEVWEEVEVLGERSNIPNPARFIGPQNAVQVQVNRELAAGSMYIGQLGVEQRGVF